MGFTCFQEVALTDLGVIDWVQEVTEEEYQPELSEEQQIIFSDEYILCNISYKYACIYIEMFL